MLRLIAQTVAKAPARAFAKRKSTRTLAIPLSHIFAHIIARRSHIISHIIAYIIARRSLATYSILLAAILLPAMLTALLPTTANAQATSRGHISLTYGLAVPDLENTRTHNIYGINAGALISEQLGVGGYHYLSNSLKGPNDGTFHFSLTGIEGRFYLVNDDKQVFFSLRAGVSKLNNKINDTGFIFSPYHWGVASGYSLNLWSRFSFGVEGSFLSFGSSKTSSGGTTEEFKAFHSINFLAVLTLHL